MRARTLPSPASCLRVWGQSLLAAPGAPASWMSVDCPLRGQGQGQAAPPHSTPHPDILARGPGCLLMCSGDPQLQPSGPSPGCRADSSPCPLPHAGRHPCEQRDSGGMQGCGSCHVRAWGAPSARGASGEKACTAREPGVGVVDGDSPHIPSPVQREPPPVLALPPARPSLSPVSWLRPGALLLLIGQAQGSSVEHSHKSPELHVPQELGGELTPTC